jgi:predicted small lipoprotein YifL
MNRLSFWRGCAVLLILTCLAASGCGNKGDLVRPGAKPTAAVR